MQRNLTAVASRKLSVLWLVCLATLPVRLPAHAAESSYAATRAYQPTPADIALTTSCERKAFDYFCNETDPNTGLTKDRANNSRPDNYTVASTAATGFGLAGLAVGCERGWISRDVAMGRALTTLRFCRDKLPQEHGWFYHFVDVHTGQRAWQSEVSSIDTAFLMAGALVAGQYFGSPELARLASDIYRRVDFPWMLTDGGTKPDSRLLCHGWKPEQGFLRYRWHSYCEHMLLYLLALGSPTHPIPASCWDAWARPQAEYGGHRTFVSGPLFTHQFSHAFIDFRGVKDRLGFDYWQGSVEATRANRQFCIDQMKRFHTYGEDAWGLSACDGPDGYRAYGAPPGRADHDGTVAPLAMVASVVFTPEICLSAMHTMQTKYEARLWGRYGFCNAFNLDRNWFDPDVIGIDVGCALLMLENYRSGLIWRTLGQDLDLRSGLVRAGFHRTDKAAELRP